jgi:protein TonB
MEASAQFSSQGKGRMRLLVAIEISLVLHLAIIFGVQVGAIEQGARPRAAIEARIVALAPTPDAQAQILVKAINRPVKSTVQDFQPVTQVTATDAQKSEADTSKPGMPAAAATPTMVDTPLPVDPTYYPAREVDEHPALISAERPVYPEKAAAANVKGNVLVLFLLNENGTVDEVSVLEQNPPGYTLDAAVIEWLQHAQFKPAMRKGRAVKMRVVYRVMFEP